MTEEEKRRPTGISESDVEEEEDDESLPLVRCNVKDFTSIMGVENGDEAVIMPKKSVLEPPSEPSEIRQSVVGI
nr:hypothetical protein [Tanacetum cinerariifolium]